MKEQTINIEVGRSGLQKQIEMVQGDSGRTLKCFLTDMAIPEEALARIYVKKPDGTEVYNDCSISGSTVTIDITTQMLAAPGKAKCEIEITKDTKKVTSFIFIILVRQRALTGDAVESKDEFTALENALTKAETAEDTANEAAQKAKAAADNADAKAKKADTAAQGANTAAESASSAAGKAQAAADKANTSASNADSKAADAQAAADKANTAADNADAKAKEADTAAQGANKAAGDATAVADEVERKLEAGEFVGSVENIDTQKVNFTESATDDAPASGETISVLFGKLKKLWSKFTSHTHSSLTGTNFTVKPIANEKYTYLEMTNSNSNNALAKSHFGVDSTGQAFVNGWKKADNATTGYHLIYDNAHKPTAADVGAVNKAGDTITGQLYLSGNGDAVGTAAGNPPLIVGPKTGTHLAIDGNEIHAKNTETAVAQLSLNGEGGLVYIGKGGLEVAGVNMTITTDQYNALMSLLGG